MSLRFGLAAALTRSIVLFFFAVAIDGATKAATISGSSDECRGEEAFSDAAFAVDDEVDLFVRRRLR